MKKINIKHIFEEIDLKNRISNCIEETENLSSDYMSNKIDENFKSWGVEIKEPKVWSKEKFERSFPLMGRMSNNDWRQTKQSMTLSGEELYLKGLSEFYLQKFGVKPNLEVN